MSNYSVAQAYSLAAKVADNSSNGCKSAKRAASTFLKVAVETELTTVEKMADHFGFKSVSHMKARMQANNLPSMIEVRSFARAILDIREP